MIDEYAGAGEPFPCTAQPWAADSLPALVASLLTASNFSEQS